MDETGAPSLTTRSMRARNRHQLLELLREHGVLSQAEIARKTGLSRTTVSSLVAELRGAGLISPSLQSPSPPEGEGRGGGGRHPNAQGGRPPVMLALDDSAGAAVGIDVGLGHVRVAVANLAHTVLSERVRELDPGQAADASLSVIAGLVGEALAAADVASTRVIGVGLGLPAPIDRARGTVASSSILPGWRGVQAAHELSGRLDLPVELDNDANLGALAETVWGAGRGCAHVVYVKASERIGCGLVLDGVLFRGARGIAGEIGHTIVNQSGPVCTCGSRGC